jgi:hypothetical protein
MLGDDDMTVFFNPDFASTWVRLAGADCAYVEFPAIRGEQDVEALQAYAQSTSTELAYITADVDLREGQQLQIKGTPQLWRVRQEPQLTVDGATSVVQVGKAIA